MTSVVDRERLALQVMLLVGRHFLVGKPPWTTEALAERMNAPVRLVAELLDALAEKRLLLPVSNGQVYVPGRDLEHIGVKDILDAFRNAGEPGTVPNQEGQYEVVDALIQDVDRAVTTTLQGKNLKTLLESQGLPGVASD